MTDHVEWVGLAVRLIAEPVLIAPHGDNYHRAAKINPGDFLVRPVCRVAGVRWVPVDLEFAVLLDREPCGRCWAGPLQLTITDTEDE